MADRICYQAFSRYLKFPNIIKNGIRKNLSSLLKARYLSASQVRSDTGLRTDSAMNVFDRSAKLAQRDRASKAANFADYDYVREEVCNWNMILSFVLIAIITTEMIICYYTIFILTLMVLIL